MKKNIWITKNDKGLLEAENDYGKVVATSGSLETLESSLDDIYNYNWRAYVGMV